MRVWEGTRLALQGEGCLLCLCFAPHFFFFLPFYPVILLLSQNSFINIHPLFSSSLSCPLLLCQARSSLLLLLCLSLLYSFKGRGVMFPSSCYFVLSPVFLYSLQSWRGAKRWLCIVFFSASLRLTHTHIHKYMQATLLSISGLH